MAALGDATLTPDEAQRRLDVLLASLRRYLAELEDANNEGLEFVAEACQREIRKLQDLIRRHCDATGLPLSPEGAIGVLRMTRVLCRNYVDAKLTENRWVERIRIVAPTADTGTLKPHGASQMTLPNRDHLRQALRFDRSNEPLGIGV